MADLQTTVSRNGNGPSLATSLLDTLFHTITLLANWQKCQKSGRDPQTLPPVGRRPVISSDPTPEQRVHSCPHCALSAIWLNLKKGTGRTLSKIHPIVRRVTTPGSRFSCGFLTRLVALS